MTSQRNKRNTKKDSMRFIFGWFVTFALRLLPFRPPNIEPILAVQMPFSKKYGKLAAFIFAFANILLFDFVTSGIGTWTFVVGGVYGLVGIAAVYYFQKFKSSVLSYAYFAIIGTIAFDALTGLTVGPLFFGQPFMSALAGQIPFTLMHLLGNITLAMVASPLIEKYIVDNPKILEAPFVYNGGKILTN